MKGGSREDSLVCCHTEAQFKFNTAFSCICQYCSIYMRDWRSSKHQEIWEVAVEGQTELYLSLDQTSWTMYKCVKTMTHCVLCLSAAQNHWKYTGHGCKAEPKLRQHQVQTRSKRIGRSVVVVAQLFFREDIYFAKIGVLLIFSFKYLKNSHGFAGAGDRLTDEWFLHLRWFKPFSLPLALPLVH